MNEIEVWKPRSRVINLTAVSDYVEVARFRPTTKYRVKLADDSAVKVNCFIRRMIRNSRANNV